MTIDTYVRYVTPSGEIDDALLTYNSSENTLALSIGNNLHQFTEQDLFTCLREANKELAATGCKLLLAACQKNVWASRMMRVGKMGYLLQMGKRASLDEVVDLLAPIEQSQWSSPQEQDEWIRMFLENVRQ